MNIAVVGLSHKTAPVEVREKLSIPEDQIEKAIVQLCSYPHIEEAVILSTCNRIRRILNQLFKQAITAAKRVRTQTAIGTGAVSISSAAVELAQIKVQNLSDCRVAIVGAGNMARRLVQHLLAKGATPRTNGATADAARYRSPTPCPPDSSSVVCSRYGRAI